MALSRAGVRPFAAPGAAAVSAVLWVFAAAFVVACTSAPDGPVTIKTGDNSGACLLAAVGGELVADPTLGLALKGSTGNRAVVFPYGYSALRRNGVVFLVDSHGNVVAKEGDEVHGAGANAEDTTFLMCDLEVVPAPSPSA